MTTTPGTHQGKHCGWRYDNFKVLKHDEALKHIIQTVLSKAGINDSIIVPFFIHFDEHGR
jgi:hypothetical protein